MVLRGDISPDCPPKTDFKYASDLAAFIKTHEPGFNLLGACYPERHYQAESMEKDIEHLKIKIDNGITHLITQLFLIMNVFLLFVTKLRKLACLCLSRPELCPSPILVKSSERWL